MSNLNPIQVDTFSQNRWMVSLLGAALGAEVVGDIAGVFVGVRAGTAVGLSVGSCWEKQQ